MIMFVGIIVFFQAKKERALLCNGSNLFNPPASSTLNGREGKKTRRSELKRTRENTRQHTASDSQRQKRLINRVLFHPQTQTPKLFIFTFSNETKS